jgi:hypothetical protein
MPLLSVVVGVASLTPLTYTPSAVVDDLTAAETGAFATMVVAPVTVFTVPSLRAPRIFPAVLNWMERSRLADPGDSAIIEMALLAANDLGTPKT